MIYRCMICNFVTSTQYNYKRHLLTKKHQEKVSTLPKLSYSYPVVSKKSSNFVCNFCQSTFTNKCNLSKHRSKCGQIKEFIKKLCEKDKNATIALDIQRTISDHTLEIYIIKYIANSLALDKKMFLTD